MPNQSLSQRPEVRLALQLSLILWLAALSVTAPAAILTGQVSTTGEYLSLATGFVTALVLALPLYMAYRAVWPGRKRFAWPLLASAVFMIAGLQTGADYGGQFLLSMVFPALLLPPSGIETVLRVFIIYLCLYSCNLALFALAAETARAREAEASRAEVEAAMLRLQLNPHFMVNSLNAVTSLILSGQNRKAAAMTDKLSQFLRLSLQLSDQPLITLADELFAIDTYLEAEFIRFGDRLDVRIDCPGELDEALVPNFILQPLVENAVKHGMSGTVGVMPLVIQARADGEMLHLIVENDVPSDGEGAQPPSFSMGLANTRHRLNSLFGSRAALHTAATQDGFRAEVRLPMTFSMN